MLLSFNVSLSFSQSKAKTIKKGAMYSCCIESPKQVAISGIPAWVFSTLGVGFLDSPQGVMSGQNCAYAINTYTGGLGEPIIADPSESIEISYKVKNGLVYLWDPSISKNEPKDESGYILILRIENDETLTPIKTSSEAMLNIGSFVYMGNYFSTKNMSDEALAQLEINGLTKLLSLRNQKPKIELIQPK